MTGGLELELIKNLLWCEVEEVVQVIEQGDEIIKEAQVSMRPANTLAVNALKAGELSYQALLISFQPLFL